MIAIFIIVSVVFVIGVIARILSRPTLWEGIKTLIRAGIFVFVVFVIMIAVGMYWSGT